ncbi:hypothetical protein TNCV_598731 [Trichonephila clavipes]|nr:hypothetical protein TNCV_598731 [Trichonephila clavipes]
MLSEKDKALMMKLLFSNEETANVALRKFRIQKKNQIGKGESFHNDVSMEEVDRREPNNTKNWQWTTEGDVSDRRSTPVPHGSG